MSKTALVTGASSGIGKETALALAKEGYTVYGTSRKPEAVLETYPGITLLPLDLTEEASIQQLISGLPDIDVLINNAGASLMSAVEETPPEKIRWLFELLLFGNIRLIQGILPGMREKGRGIIINIGSMSELAPVPYSSVYASAKAALHVFSTGLRQEVRPFGIDVVTVVPTYINTPIKQERLCKDNSVYMAYIRKAGEFRDAKIRSGASPKAVAEKIVKIIRLKKPASYYAVGENARLFSLALRFLPNAIKEPLLVKHFKIPEEIPSYTGS